jgi:hypothetical protein
MPARARWRLLALSLAFFLVAGSVKPEAAAAPKPPVPKAISVSYWAEAKFLTCYDSSVLL